MSNQPEPTLIPQELRQALLTEIEASRQAITELNDEELEAVVGRAGEGNDQGMSTGQKVGIAAGTVGGVTLVGGGAVAYGVHKVKSSIAGKAIKMGIDVGKKILTRGK